MDIPFKTTKLRENENGPSQVFPTQIYLTGVHTTQFPQFSPQYTFSPPRNSSLLENGNAIAQGKPRGKLSTIQNIQFLRK